MAKKFIGIDFDGEVLRIATAESAKGTAILAEVTEHPLNLEKEGLSDALSQALPDLAFGDRMAACLPSSGSFFRQLEFPFNDPKKIESTLALEMGSQVPSNEELIFDFLLPQPEGKHYKVPAAAVKKAAVHEIVELFHAAGQSAQIVDLAPFAYAAGLRSAFSDGILAVVDNKTLTIAQVAEGKVQDYRCHLLKGEHNPERLTGLIRRDYFSLAGGSREETLPLYLMGSGVTDGLQENLKHVGLNCTIPELRIKDSLLPPAMLPAAALAIRAALPSRTRQFNFLKGDLAPRGEWAGFRRQAIAAGILAGIVLLLAGVGAYVNLSHLQSRAEALSQEMTSVYRHTFPESTVIVDVTAQMKSNLAQLQEKANLLGFGKDRSALNLLREISTRIPSDITLDVRELAYSEDQLRIDGITGSFEAINRLSEGLEESPLFAEVQIADAKMSIDGSKIDFRLNLKVPQREMLQ